MKMNTEETQQLMEVINNSNLSVAQIINLITSHKTEASKEIVLSVSYGKTIEPAIGDGNYLYKDKNINATNFPILSELIGMENEIVCKLFNFDHNIIPTDVISKMDKAGFRPATLMELLTLGANHPDLQRQFTIVALGSSCKSSIDDTYAPVLTSVYAPVAKERRLDLYLYYPSNGWSVGFNFLGVHK